MQIRPKTRITPVESVEIGLQLMMLKASVRHGEFMPRLELLGYSFREAQRFMMAARKFHGASNARLLEAVDTVSKLKELSALEDDELDALKSGGEVQGITLDSIKYMTVKELRAAIRGVSCLRNQESVSDVKGRVFREFCERTRNVQDVTDKRSTAPAAVALAEDLFNTLPLSAQPSASKSPILGDLSALPLPVPPSAPAAPVEIPQAFGWHVAGLQFVNPIGTWRMACTYVNQGTRYVNVTYRPAPARAGYRSIVGGHAS